MDFMKAVGIYDAAGEAKAEIIPFDDGPWVEVHPEAAKHWEHGFRIPRLIQEVDHIISLPVVKTHRIATFTMSLKNFVGIIHPTARTGYLHRQQHYGPTFGRLIAEINLAATPSFIVADGTRAFISGGPARGEMVEPGLILAPPSRG